MAHEIQIPSEIEMGEGDGEALMDTWRSNHETLLRRLQGEEFQYFGLHGTPKDNLRKIEESRKGNFEVATFYDMDSSERRLFQFYGMADYASAYGLYGDYQGGVLVLDLDFRGGNSTLSWEKLLLGGLIEESTDFDNDHETEMFGLLARLDNRLDRSGLDLIESTFPDTLKGIIRIEEVPYANAELSGMNRNIMRHRFTAQDVFSRSLDYLVAK